MKRRIIALFICLALVNLAGCGDAADITSISGDNTLPSNDGQAPAADVTYVEANGLEILPHGDAVLTGVVYYGADPENYNMQTACNITAGEVTSSSDGSIDVLQIPFTLTMTGEYTDDCIAYTSAITPSICLADKYTGLILPVKDSVGDEGFSYSASLGTADGNMDITYGCDVKCTTSDYYVSDDNKNVCDIIFEVTYTVTVPAGYDGLILKITPVTEYYEESDDDAGELTSSECIADDYPDGTILMELR